MRDRRLMQRCLDLAQLAKGNTSPNPMVGAVLVYNDRIIGEGYHHFYGAAHAEVNCIRNVKEEDKYLIPESTMYVNLEPCAHYGLTPPCATMLAKEKVKKVVIASTDPFAQVSGKGIGTLKDAGIEVETGIMEPEARWLNRRFFCYHQQQRPYIVLKWAQTADGFIAPADRRRMQITCPESQQLVHKWRTQEAAIMVGYNTALMDDPQLTARATEGRQPLRIILDRKLLLPHTHHVYDGAAATWIVNEQKEILFGNVHAVLLPFDDELLIRLLQKLHEARILSLIIEGGAQLLNSFFSQGLWDEARIFTGVDTLVDGIKAPAIRDSNPAFATEVGRDLLRVVTNTNSAYRYIKGMEL